MSIVLIFIFTIIFSIIIVTTIFYIKNLVDYYIKFKLTLINIVYILYTSSVLTLTCFKTRLIINFIDYKCINYFNIIKINFSENNESINEIKNKYISIPVFIIDNKNVFDCKISIINTFTNKSRTFKFSIYKNFINNINMYINNNSDKYYSSEIIFYGDINKVKVKDFQCDKFNLKKRLRCIIVNIQETKLFELIKDNNIYNDKLNLEISNVLSTNENKNLIINIFIGKNKSNVLIFGDEEQKLILATEEDKKIFSEFCVNVMKETKKESIINKLCQSLCVSLISRSKLFGLKIIDIISINLSLFIFLNQGINCLLNENNIDEKDKNFIVGCLILLLYINKKIINLEEIKTIKEIIDKMEMSGFNEIEQIKALIAYIFFYIKNSQTYFLRITKDLEQDNPYKIAFDFYESIINELNEDSELLLIYLQLNSGSGINILNNKNCYKISMLSISEIKKNLVNNIPKYFYCYFNNYDNQITLIDSTSHIIAFNTTQIFLKQNNQISENEIINSNIMNIVISIFHKIRKPIMFITKEYELLNQKNFYILNENNDEESVACIDFYLYNFKYYPAQILISSYQSYYLMNKNYFINELDDLNNIAKKIIKEKINQNSNNPSDLNNLDGLKNIINEIIKKNNDEVEHNYIIIDGKKYFCGSYVNY